MRVIPVLSLILIIIKHHVVIGKNQNITDAIVDC